MKELEEGVTNVIGYLKKTNKTKYSFQGKK